MIEDYKNYRMIKDNLRELTVVNQNKLLNLLKDTKIWKKE